MNLYTGCSSEFPCVIPFHAASFPSLAFYEIKSKPTPTSCCNWCTFYLVLLLAPHCSALSPEQCCRWDCSQFASTNKKSLLGCTVLGSSCEVWVRLVGAGALGRQVGFWGFEQPGPIGCLLITRIRQWWHKKGDLGFLSPRAMGNTPSVPEEAEDDNTCTVKSYQVSNPLPPPLAAASAICTPWCPQNSAFVIPASPWVCCQCSKWICGVCSEPSPGRGWCR